MESQSLSSHGGTIAALARRSARAIANAWFEALLVVLLILTVAAIVFEDRLLVSTMRFTPASIASYTRLPIADHDIGGNSTAQEDGPLHWSCDLRPGNPYPYCGYELFFDGDKGIHGLDLTNLRSLEVALLYRGTATSFRVHLKNFDPRYSHGANDDTPKFLRVEFSTDPGKLQHVVFNAADFGVADWWLRKWRVPPELSHPEFNNITSMNFETGTEALPGHHEFEIREIVLHRTRLTEAQWLQAILGIWVLLIGTYLAHRFATMQREVEQRRTMHALALRQAEEAGDAARHDPLTRIFNRRGIFERYDELSAGTPVPLGVILIDIDRFKMLNDSFGHNYGDEVLSSIAALIRRNARGGDTIGRWGGEEFLVLCPGLDAEGTVLVAENIRRRIEHFHFGDCERVTASFGVHWCPATGPLLTELVSLADVALYTAKAEGRNRTLRFRPGMAKAA
ncbi:MAG: GGDEF domain-containing protein [Sphingomonas sp.]